MKAAQMLISLLGVVLLVHGVAGKVDIYGRPDWDEMMQELGRRSVVRYMYYDYYPPPGQLEEDFPVLEVTYENPAVLVPTGNFTTVGMETFNDWPQNSMEDTGENTQNGTNFGINPAVLGVDPKYPIANYAGYQIIPNDEYGGADAEGNYIRLGPNMRFGVAINPSLNLTYFGYWLASMDEGNVVHIRTAEDGYFEFGAEHVLNTLLARPDNDEFLGNPVEGPFLGDNPLEHYVFVNFYLRKTFISSIVFSQDHAGGHESDNHCVGVWSSVGGNQLNPPVHPEVEIEQPTEGVVHPEVEIELPTEGVEHPEVEIELPTEGVEHPEVEIEQPSEGVVHPEVEIELPTEGVEHPEVEIELPTQAPVAPTELVDIDGPEVEQPDLHPSDAPPAEESDTTEPGAGGPAEESDTTEPGAAGPPEESNTTEAAGAGGPPVGVISGAAAGGVAALAGLGYAAYSFLPSTSTPPLETPSAQNEMEIRETEREQAASSDGLWA